MDGRIVLPCNGARAHRIHRAARPVDPCLRQAERKNEDFRLRQNLSDRAQCALTRGDQLFARSEAAGLDIRSERIEKTSVLLPDFLRGLGVTEAPVNPLFQRRDGINTSGAKREHAVIEVLARRLVEHGGSRVAIEPIEPSSNQSPADMLREAGAGRRDLIGQAPSMLRSPKTGNPERVVHRDGGSPERAFRKALIRILHRTPAFARNRLPTPQRVARLCRGVSAHPKPPFPPCSFRRNGLTSHRAVKPPRLSIPPEPAAVDWRAPAAPSLQPRSPSPKSRSS